MTNLQAWILAARPKTLSASVVPIVATAGMVHGLTGELQWWILGCAVSSSFCIQIGTNLVNDAMDFKKGADNENRIGPMRVTQQGLFTFRQVMIVAAVFFSIAVVFGIPLAIYGGWPIVLIGVVSVVMGYAYTGGPYPLAYKGLGDLFVVIFFGLIAVCGLNYLLSGLWTLDAVILGLQIGFLSTVLIAINNLRDMETDREVSKRTLAVRLGKTGGRFWIGFLCFAPFLLGYYWLHRMLWWVYIIPLFSFPLAISIAKKIFGNEPSPAYNKYLAMASAYSLLFSALIAIGFHLK